MLTHDNPPHEKAQIALGTALSFQALLAEEGIGEGPGIRAEDIWREAKRADVHVIRLKVDTDVIEFSAVEAHGVKAAAAELSDGAVTITGVSDLSAVELRAVEDSGRYVREPAR